jgi:hypothetical protein
VSHSPEHADRQTSTLGRRASPLLPSPICQAFGASFFTLMYDVLAQTSAPQCGCSATSTLPGLPSDLPLGFCTTANLIKSAIGGVYPLPTDSNGNQIFTNNTFFCAASPGCGTPLYTVANKSMVCTGPGACFPAINVTTCSPSAQEHVFPAGCGFDQLLALADGFNTATQANFSKQCSTTGAGGATQCGAQGFFGRAYAMLGPYMGQIPADCRFSPDPAEIFFSGP